MKLADIMALPVVDVAAPMSHLYLWCPNAILPDGLAIMKALRSLTNPTSFGTSYGKTTGWTRRRLLFPQRNRANSVWGRGKNARTLKPGRKQVNFLATRKREHSRKPDEIYPIIEGCSQGPRIELFARGQRRGWLCWGDQAVADYEPDWPTYKNHSGVLIAAE